MKRVAEVVSEISNACLEQSLAIENVNSAVASVDMVTQLNAAQSEELSSGRRNYSRTLSSWRQWLAAFVSREVRMAITHPR